VYADRRQRNWSSEVIANVPVNCDLRHRLSMGFDVARRSQPVIPGQHGPSNGKHGSGGAAGCAGAAVDGTAGVSVRSAGVSNLGVVLYISAGRRLDFEARQSTKTAWKDLAEAVPQACPVVW